MKKKLLKIFLVAAALLIIGLIWFVAVVTVNPPEVSAESLLESESLGKRKTLGENFYALGPNWLRKSDSGLWEIYLEGSPYERGLVNGTLCKELCDKQEEAFISQIKKIVPSESYLQFLKYFIAFFNRNLDESVPQEYRLEIFGASQSASDKYDFIAPPYHRILNYHAAHDIGHALQDRNMVVGCTSFSAWGKASADSSLIVARNFDFYVGDEFAKEKVVYFVNPDSGYKFMSIAWGGMVGVVSGMNEKGLTVTMNAGKSDMPSGASTPISIVAREILQYAATIDEAYTLAASHATFVSEALMIGSAADGRTAIIEKSPDKIGLYKTGANENRILCSNHFQGEVFANDELNVKNINETDSKSRYTRLTELLNNSSPVDVIKAAEILRDRRGTGNTELGIGSQLAINQLNGHHAIIFKPEDLKVWISTSPWQMGPFVEYDLRKIFALAPGLIEKQVNAGLLPSNFEIREPNSGIGADTFMLSPAFENYMRFRKLKEEMHDCLSAEENCTLSESVANEIIATNPEFWYAYEMAADFFALKKNCEKAAGLYKIALEKKIPSVGERQRVEKKLKDLMC